MALLRNEMISAKFLWLKCASWRRVSKNKNKNKNKTKQNNKNKNKTKQKKKHLKQTKRENQISKFLRAPSILGYALKLIENVNTHKNIPLH